MKINPLRVNFFNTGFIINS